MANELLTPKEYIEILKRAGDRFPYAPLFKDSVHSYMGKRIIMRTDGWVILFEACEWCGNKTLDKRNNCSTCGGYPTAKPKKEKRNE